MTAPAAGAREPLDDRFAADMGRLLGPDFPDSLALAVSGGGDSMAMLALAHNWARVWGVPFWVVTVDHGLRDESAAEAALVARECDALGHPHATLRWRWDGAGNLMDAARRGRLALIDRWRGGIGHVLFAHTIDDVAETFLMRLARGAGVDGLAAMAELRRVVPHPAGMPSPIGEDLVAARGARPPRPADGGPGGFETVRPLLGTTRRELRHHARVLHVPWVDDPTNDDPAHDRARMRRLLGLLAGEGLDGAALAATSRRMRRARRALALRAADLARAALVPAPAGAVCLDRDAFAASDRETQARLLSALLRQVSGVEYGPRGAPLEGLLDRLLSGGRGTLHGCEAEAGRAVLRLWRDFGAVRELVAPAVPGAVWDGRWRLSAGADFVGPGADEIRALGDAGWSALPRDRENPREPGRLAVPYRIARTLPALWQGGRPVAVPGLGIGTPAHLEDLRPADADAVAALLLSD